MDTEKLIFNQDHFKILPIKKDKNVVIYSVKYNREKMKEFIKYLNGKYNQEIIDVVETEFYDAVPLSMGKYDLDKKYQINKYKILELNNIETKEENNMYFPSKGYGKIKVNVNLKPTITKVLEDTFLEDSKKVLLDTTSIIKYTNHVFKLPNNFKFDKTIDLYRKGSSWKEKGNKFVSIENYRHHLNTLAYNLNNDNIELNDKEKKKIENDISEIVNEYQKLFDIEQIGMFPIVDKMEKKYAVLTRYALRNQSYDWHFNVLDDAEVNYDGGQILNEYEHEINNNYDLDGYNYEYDAIMSIKNSGNLQDLIKIKKTS